MRKEYLTEKEVSDYSGYARSTLQHWRWSGQGPKFNKVRQRVLYPLLEIESYFSNFPLQQSTSQTIKEVSHGQ